jgi:cysteine sulfinate desulfinase/cysteine desulfurase-like protein
MALGYKEYEARSVLRISMLPGTDSGQVAKLVAALRKALKL